MANLKINLPLQTGSVERDFNELYSWANRLVAELRTLLYVLDSSNIRYLDAAKIVGGIDINRLTGTAARLYVNELNFADDSGVEGRLYIKDGELYINNKKINTEEVQDGD